MALMRVREEQALEAPQVCCCCLNPRDVVRERRVAAEWASGRRAWLTVPLPWCRGCRRMRGAVWGTMGVTFASAAGAGYGLGKIGGLVVGIAAGASVFALSFFVQRLPPFKRRGHVVCCDGFLGGAWYGRGEEGAREEGFHLVLRNREFASRWERENSLATRARSPRA